MAEEIHVIIKTQTAKLILSELMLIANKDNNYFIL